MKNKSKKAIDLQIRNVQSAIGDTQKIIKSEIARVEKYQLPLVAKQSKLIALLNKLK